MLSYNAMKENNKAWVMAYFHIIRILPHFFTYYCNKTRKVRQDNVEKYYFKA